MSNHPPPAAASGAPDLNQVRALIDALAPLLGVTNQGQDDPQVSVHPDGSAALNTGQYEVQVAAGLAGVETLNALIGLGRLAQALDAARTQHARTRREQEQQVARAHALMKYAHADAATFGLIDLPGAGWTLAPATTTPDHPGNPENPAPTRVMVRQVETVRSEGWRVPNAATLEVTSQGTVIGRVTVTADEEVSTVGQYAHAYLDSDLLDRATRQALVTANPWNTYRAPDAGAGVRAHVRALTEVADQVRDWVIRMGEALAAIAVAKEARAAETVAWAKKSRSKERIPAGLLKTWLSSASHVSYDAAGSPSDGWRVIAEPVVGESRPSHLNGRGSKRSVGAKEVLYVARLVHVDGRFSSRRSSYLTFNNRQIDGLREALPGCVVKVPEDRRAIFVAYDSPDYLEALDAALVEWVLTGPDA